MIVCGAGGLPPGLECGRTVLQYSFQCRASTSASRSVSKISPFRNSSRICELKLSQYPFSHGLLGLM